MTPILTCIPAGELFKFAEEVVSDPLKWETYSVQLDEDKSWRFRTWHRLCDEHGDGVTITDFDSGGGVKKTVEVRLYGQACKFSHASAIHLEALYENAIKPDAQTQARPPRHQTTNPSTGGAPTRRSPV